MTRIYYTSQRPDYTHQMEVLNPSYHYEHISPMDDPIESPDGGGYFRSPMVPEGEVIQSK